MSSGRMFPHGSRPVHRRAEGRARVARLALLLGLAEMLVVGQTTGAASPTEPRSFGHDIQPLLQARCYRCHNPLKKKGGIDLASVQDDQTAARTRKLWRKVLAQVEARSMPPPGARQLSLAQSQHLVQWLEATLKAAPALTRPDPGPTVIRRLTRAEYDNTIRDLLGVPFDSAEEVGMTDDPVGENDFNNLAAALDVSPALMDKYFTAADKVLDRLLGVELRSEVDYRIVEQARVAREHLFSLRPGAWRNPQSEVKPPAGVSPREAAAQLIGRVARRAYRRPLRPGEVAALLRLYDRATSRGQSHVAAVRLMLKGVLVSPPFLFRIEVGRPAQGPAQAERLTDHELAVRLSYFLWSSMPDGWLLELADQGLLTAERVPATPVHLRGRVMGVSTPRDRFDAVLEDVFDGDLQTYYEGPRPDGCWVGLDLLSPKQLTRIRYAARQDQPGRLVGGKFQACNSADFQSGVVDLFTVTQSPPPGWITREINRPERFRYVRFVSPKGGCGNIAEVEVWGILDGPVLPQQVRRMLRDPKARALTDHFATPWLQINRLPAARPSSEFFPDFQPDVRKALYDETATFFDRLRTENRDVRELLDANYTYLNEDLAKYYHIPGVHGKELQRVALKPEYHRGGLLGMGSILAVTSHTSRTSPTLRGKWILDVIFGTPPPPPPPDAGKFKDEQAGAKVPRSFREKLQLHATQESCQACHRKLDPLGFALENYNAVGAWRDQDGTRPLDNTGVLPTGEHLNGVQGLKQVILKRQDEFVRNVIERLLAYALGRELQDADEGPVQQIQAAVARDACRFEALILGVVNSYPFQYRRIAVSASDRRGMGP